MVASAYDLRLAPGKVEPAPKILAIKALAEPQTLSRITGLLAQFGVIPSALSSRHAGDFLVIDIQFHIDSETRADIMLAKIRSAVAVQRASLVNR